MQSRFDEKAVEARAGRSRDGSARRNEKRSAGNGAIPLRGSGLRRRSLRRQLTSLRSPSKVEPDPRSPTLVRNRSWRQPAGARASGVGTRKEARHAGAACRQTRCSLLARRGSHRNGVSSGEPPPSPVGSGERGRGFMRRGRWTGASQPGCLGGHGPARVRPTRIAGGSPVRWDSVGWVQSRYVSA